MSQIQQRCLDDRLVEDEDRILIAVSGGPDSVFLLLMLNGMKEQYNLSLRVFHLNHLLRDTAERDELFVREMCRRMNVPCDSFKSDIKEISISEKISQEEAGRNERYRLIGELMRRHGCKKAATAHHADDQAETVLMRMMRGTGLRGLGGMAGNRNGIIRPLLKTGKKEIVDFLNENGIEYVHDESNDSDDYLRNRIRNRIMPLMHAENPNVANRICELSDIASRADEFISQYAAETMRNDGHMPGEMRYNLLIEQKRIVQEYMIRALLADAGYNKDVSYTHISAVLDKVLQQNDTIWELDLPNCTVTRSYDKISVRSVSQEDFTESFHYPIGTNGSYFFPKERFALRLKLTKKIEKNRCNPYIKTIDYDKIKHNLTLRSRRNGDFFHPFGLNGKKTLKKYFIDKKIPKQERDRIPLLCDGDAIVCVIGWEIDDRYKVSEATETILRLEYISLEE